MSQRRIQYLTVSFVLFILWVIYMANTGQPMIFFRLLRDVPFGDKMSHFLLFGLLTLGVNLSTGNKRVGSGRFRLPAGTLGVLIFVVLEELSQHFIASRTLDAVDLLADLLGIGMFTLLGLEWGRRKRFHS